MSEELDFGSVAVGVATAHYVTAGREVRGKGEAPGYWPV